MNFEEEFASVSLITSSSFETRGVDAFALALIKAEKQARRIFTFLIYQHSNYTISHCDELRSTLAENRYLYFKNFINGIEMILAKDLAKIYGLEYDNDLTQLLTYTRDRNKIFHGQVTLDKLSRKNLLDRVEHITKWCKQLGETINTEIGYDGFSKSYIKSEKPLLLENLTKFDSIANYQQFLKKI